MRLCWTTRPEAQPSRWHDAANPSKPGLILLKVSCTLAGGLGPTNDNRLAAMLPLVCLEPLGGGAAKQDVSLWRRGRMQVCQLHSDDAVLHGHVRPSRMAVEPLQIVTLQESHQRSASPEYRTPACAYAPEDMLQDMHQPALLSK